MKKRVDFVTNSSSASYIICFARVADEEKASKIIEKHKLEYGEEVLNADGVEEKKGWSGILGADWCGAEIWEASEIVANNPDATFIVVSEKNDARYSEYGDPIYDYDFLIDKVIADLTEENGFADVHIATGEGRDG